MSIVQAYEVIERVIVSEMVDMLKYDGEATIEEWAQKRRERFQDLNAFVITTLGYNNRRIVEGVQEAIADAEALIREHIQEEWQFEEVQVDSEEQAEQAIQFLNENIQRSLISVYPQTGTVEQLYNQVIDTALEDDSGDEIETVLYSILLSQLGQGLSAGFVQSDGIRWKLDRYINEVEKHMYQGVYERTMKEMLEYHGVELVKVFNYVRPRDACVGLEQSGIICIVPRNQASEEAQKYANIWDPQHKYGQPDGHSGINCRHVWHHIHAQKNRAERLYEAIDRNILNLEVKRMRFMQSIRSRLGGGSR